VPEPNQPAGSRRLNITSIISPTTNFLADKDWVRGALAFSLLFILLVEVCAALYFIVFSDRLSDDKIVAAAKDIIALLLNPTVALVGAATGFYYGGKQ
jgi:hypothetical protein